MQQEDRQVGVEQSEPFVIGPGASAQIPEQRDRGTEAFADNFLMAAQDLANRLRVREEELSRLVRTTERINQGVALDEILDFIYEEMRSVIPYNRIGFALVDDEQDTVVSRWARSDREILLGKGYKARLEGSTLQQILRTGRPRIINDLEAHFRGKPSSAFTGLIVREGMRSSLTCPLIVQGKPVGFMFFSSVQKDAYSNADVAFFQQIAGQLSVNLEKGRLYSELAAQKAIIEEQNKRMSQELDMARQLQRALIPPDDFRVPGFEIAFQYQPASQIGGDVLDMWRLEDGRVLFFVGDAMGHGVQAALVMSAVKTALQSAVHPGVTAEEVLTSLNRTLAKLFTEQFVTAACCIVDPATRRAECALAGHDKPLWFRAAVHDLVEKTVGGGPPLGIDENAEFEPFSFQLDPCDVLLFCTDGIVEAFNRHGDQYGQERLKAQLCEHGRAGAADILKAIVGDLRKHCGGRTMEDDVTLLVIHTLEGEGPA